MSILLVHGAWHGAWCWSPVLTLLEARGVEAVAVDLPGHGARRSAAPGVRLADYAACVVEAAAGMTAPPLLVGHSMGGMVISAAAETDPAAFRALLYLAAFLPKSGQSLFELAAEQGERFGEVVDGEIHLDREEARRLFYEDCDPEQAAWALDRIQPQPMGPAGDPVALTAERFDRLARDYVVCARDRAIDPAFQRQMAARGACRTIVELDSGHSPFLACPSVLAQLLIDNIRG